MKRALIVPLSLLLLPSSFAGTTSEPFGGGAWMGVGAQPMGQTFTADAPTLVSATFFIKDYSWTGPGHFTYLLLAGAGTNGPVLASSPTFTVPQGVTDSFTENFPSVSLTVGAQYTILISTTNIYNEIGYVQTDLPGFVDYKGGDAVILGKVDPEIDLGFQIQTIPEPATAAMVACGAFAVVLVRAPRSNQRRCRN